MGKTEQKETGWYDTEWGRSFYWGILAATLLGVAATVSMAKIKLPPIIYLYGFLGASVYAFTSFAKQFDRDDRYRLKILSRTVAVLPLVTGVYLLAFAFPDISGQLEALDISNASETKVTDTDRLVAGLVFITGIYVSATLKAIGGIAERLLGVSTEDRQPRATGESDLNTGPEGESNEGSLREESSQNRG